VKVLLLDEASAQFEAEATWWRENRDHKELFVDEFEATLRRIVELPQAGQHYRWKGGCLIQRWLMSKTRCHVYYFHDRANDILEIHSVWGARRKRSPRL
jgi:plasmid stabilization system protein ParE